MTGTDYNAFLFENAMVSFALLNKIVLFGVKDLRIWD
jgi:hypothetical protein